VTETILMNRAPVLTLWAATVAERLGYKEDEALSIGKAVAGLNAQSKGRRLGIFKPASPRVKKAKGRIRGEEFWVEICGRHVPVAKTPMGLRAVNKDQIIDSKSVERYLESKFGESLEVSRSAMRSLAGSFSKDQLLNTAFSIYEGFRPVIPAGAKGWGVKGKLDIDRIRALAGKK
jgi:hypothetical protein